MNNNLQHSTNIDAYIFRWGISSSNVEIDLGLMYTLACFTLDNNNNKTIPWKDTVMDDLLEVTTRNKK